MMARRFPPATRELQDCRRSRVMRGRAQPISRWLRPPAVPANTQTPEGAAQQSRAAGTVSRLRHDRFFAWGSRQIYPFARPRRSRGRLGTTDRRATVLDDGQFGDDRAYVLERLQLRPRGDMVLELKIDLHQRQFVHGQTSPGQNQIATNYRIETSFCSGC